MATSNRSTQYLNVYKVLKKVYQPVSPPTDRTVLEHLLFACCLENAHYEAAEEAYAAVIHTFFDFNEIRVTTVTELSEVMANLPDPAAAANRLKRVLQSVFEESYSFDLEAYRKKNLGPTVKWLKKVDGTSEFTVSYVVQAALAGHSIPVNSGALAVFRILEIISEKELEASAAPGLERAIAKAKGVEFGSLLHQLGVDFAANPYSPAVRKIILEIDPAAKDRLPKRRVARKKKPAEEKPTKKKAAKKKAAKTTKTSKTPKTKKAAESKTSKRKKPAAKTPKAAPKKAKKKSASARISKRKPR